MLAPLTLASSAVQPRSVVVVGNGPLGSAAGRHLAEAGFSVTVLGSRKLTSSSHDRGRISRGMDAEGNTVWANRNAASLEAFRELQDSTGINFYTPCGALIVGGEPFVQKAAQGQHVENFDSRLQRDFEFFSPYPSAFAVFDPAAGHIDPYAMVEAQNTRARALGAQVLEDGTVQRLEIGEAKGVWAHLVGGGMQLHADLAVVCGGAYTNHLLVTSGIDRSSSQLETVKISRRTVVLAEVSEEDATTRLAGMPTVKWQYAGTQSAAAPDGHSATEAATVYILPPIQYPEYGNRWFIKIGGGPNDFMDPQSGDDSQQLEAFYGTAGDTVLADKLLSILHSVFPSTEFLSSFSKPCVTTCSPDGALQLCTLASGRVIAATGCQGKAAMCADAIGRELADLALSSSALDL